MASTLFVSKSDHFPFEIFVCWFFRSISEKVRWALRFSYLRDPGFHWPLRSFVLTKLCAFPCQQNCLLWWIYLLSLWPCFLKVYLFLGNLAFNSCYLGLHACLVKPMRFIQLKIQMGNGQRIKIWLWWFWTLESCFTWPEISKTHLGPSCPPSAGVSTTLLLGLPEP